MHDQPAVSGTKTDEEDSAAYERTISVEGDCVCELDDDEYNLEMVEMSIEDKGNFEDIYSRYARQFNDRSGRSPVSAFLPVPAGYDPFFRTAHFFRDPFFW